LKRHQKVKKEKILKNREENKDEVKLDWIMKGFYFHNGEFQKEPSAIMDNPFEVFILEPEAPFYS
jgi:hypothetical protein